MEGLKESASLTWFFAFIFHFYQYFFLQRSHLYSTHGLLKKKKKKSRGGVVSINDTFLHKLRMLLMQSRCFYINYGSTTQIARLKKPNIKKE